MIISDLTYLEETNENIEGAGYADFLKDLQIKVDAQRTAVAVLVENLDVYAGARKTVSFTQLMTARAEV